MYTTTIVCERCNKYIGTEQSPSAGGVRKTLCDKCKTKRDTFCKVKK